MCVPMACLYLTNVDYMYVQCICKVSFQWPALITSGRATEAALKRHKVALGIVRLLRVVVVLNSRKTQAHNMYSQRQDEHSRSITNLTGNCSVPQP